MLSSLAFSLMTVCVKQLGGRIPVTEIVLARSVISIMLTGVGLRLRVNSLGNNRGLLLARGLAGGLALPKFFGGDQLAAGIRNGAAIHLLNLHRRAAWILLAEPLRRRIGLAVAMEAGSVWCRSNRQMDRPWMATLALMPVAGPGGRTCTAPPTSASAGCD